jgi:hypothetical protein
MQNLPKTRSCNPCLPRLRVFEVISLPFLFNVDFTVNKSILKILIEAEWSPLLSQDRGNFMVR